MKRTALALAALTATTVGLAQQTAPPADSNSRMSEADRQTLMKDCVKQVQAANPSVPEKDVKAYCDKQVKSYSRSNGTETTAPPANRWRVRLS